MIPFKSISNSKNKKCHFFHANGYPPDAYKSMLQYISSKYDLKSMLHRQFWNDNHEPEKVKSWDFFLDDIEQYTKENNINNDYGIGHSISGNLLLRSCMKNRNLYKKIVLLDPTIFSPMTIYIWKILTYLNAHPLIINARKRRKQFNNFNDVFSSYRSKKIFSKIDDIQINEYIQSIFKEVNNGVQLSFNWKWEEVMYKTAGVKDFDIWKNLRKLKTPTLIIIPEESPVLRKQATKKIEKNEYIEIKRLKNTTHLFPLEQPKNTAKIILDFFSK